MQKKIKFALFVLSTLLLANVVWGKEDDNYDEELLNLSLEKLMEIKITDVTSVSRTKQKIQDTAASIYVISSNDIMRHGATSIAEALRTVPGMQVYKMNSNTWSISTRGFNYVFANKLLVLIDGKSVYSPLFSGVNWDLQDYILEDIERIEVIRGPGAVLWGANAVNGVINIITKSAEDTQGDFMSYGFDSDSMTNLQYRHGGTFGDDVSYRLHAKNFEKGGSINHKNERNLDKWHLTKVGVRLDGGKNDSEFSIHADVYQGSTKPPLKIYSSERKQLEIINKHKRDITGAYFIGSCKKYLAQGNNITVRGYLDFLDNGDYRINQQTTTADVEIQYDIAPINKHHIIWGIGYRLANYKLDKMTQVVVENDSIAQYLYSGYLQDSISVTDKLNFIVSSRIEKHGSKNIEIQPNARFSYKLSEKSTVWGSLSRAVKVQGLSEELATSRDMIELDEDKVYHIFDNVNKLALMSVSGNPDLKSEKVLSFEMGYRNVLTHNLSLDTSAYFNQYTDLLAYIDAGNKFGLPYVTTTLKETSTPVQLLYRDITSDGHIIELITKLDNKLKAQTYGAEITLDWYPIENWELQLTYSYFDIKAKSSNKTNDAFEQLYITGNIDILESLSAKHSVFLLSKLNLSNSWEFDTQLRYNSKLKDADLGSRFAVDFRIAKDISEKIKIEFVGKDLFYPAHYEFRDTFSGIAPYKVGCSWFVKIRYYN